MKKFWTEKERQKLRELWPDTPSIEVAEALGRTLGSVQAQAGLMKLKKSKKYLASLAQNEKFLEARKNTRFEKGKKAWNKGMSITDFMSPESIANSKKTRFKKGHEPHNTKSDGMISIRGTKEGRPMKYIRIEKAKWKPLHRYTWEKENGKVPKGFNIVFKDGDPMNCKIENLEIVSNEDLMLRNSIMNYPTDIRKTIKLISKLEKSIKDAEKQNS